MAPDDHASPAAARDWRVRAANPAVAVVGATGAVGVEILACLERRGFPVGRLKLLASERSVGKTLDFRGAGVAVEALAPGAFEGIDIALFSAGGARSRRFAPEAVRAGAVVVDNSSAFRMDPDVPLVVTEVNGGALARHRGIVANPNCAAMIAAVPLWPLHSAVPIRRLQVVTYQAASGAGAAAMQELLDSTRAYLDGAPFTPAVMPHDYAFNLFSHNTDIDPESGYNDEETKVMRELRKIFAAPDLRIGATCVRVPVLRAHAIALTAEFDRPLAPGAAREILAAAPGIVVVDDRARNHFPMPRAASGRDEVLVGRIREDASDPSGRTLALFVAGDQLLKGAALNAVQIAEMLLAR
jgi:aspartate-semialdehyde dehydrogenase